MARPQKQIMACVHQEDIDYNAAGELIGICKLCGQVRRYEPDGNGQPVILKKGRINMSKGSQHERHRYLEEHKDEILADYENSGQEKMLEKWHISLSGWLNIRERWLGQEEERPKTKAADKVSGAPVFPAFDNAWPREVKIAWFFCYLVLNKGDKIG